MTNEIDDIQDKDIAETIFSEGDEILTRLHQCYGGYWRYPLLKDFCYLVNPFFPTERMKDELRANFDTLLTEYPSGMRINSLLAGKYFGIRQEFVCVGNGAAELIKCLVENHCKGKTGFVLPTFEEYPNRADASDRIQFVPSNADFRYNAKDLMEYFGDKEIKNLLLINPDNPSGNYIPFSELLQLIDWTRKNSISLIVDESFVDFTDNHREASLLHNDILLANPHLTVVKSISKSYGVPGLRLGIIASGNTSMMEKMRKEVAIWNINSFAEFYMQIFNKYEKDYLDACDKFIKERELFFNELKEISFLRVIPSAANYFLCEVTGRFTSKELTALLLQKYHILVKDCGNKSAFGGRNYIRIAVRNRADNHYLTEKMKEL